MAYTKVQLRQGTTKVQAGAQQIAASVTAAAQAAAQTAAQQAAQQAQQAATEVNSRMRAGTLGARGWVAPRLESAADYTTSTVAPAVSEAVVKNLAPRVSGALRSTARQVSPPDARSSRSIRSTLAWTSLVATVLAAAGAAGTLVWRRYRAAMAADTEPDAMAHGTGDADSATASSTAASATRSAAAAGNAAVPDDSTSASPVPASETPDGSGASTASRPSSSAW